MQYLEDHVLYIDIGASFLKALLVKSDWQKKKKVIFQHMIPSLGINIYGIENFNIFSNNINKLIYEIEYETSFKIIKVVLIYSYFFSQHITETETIALSKIILQEDLNRFHKKNHVGSNKIMHYNYFFILDHYLYISNPLGMSCKFLTLQQNYLMINQTLYDNINHVFLKNNWQVLYNYCGIYVLSEYIRNYHHNFIIIDGGYYSTRICLVENNILREFYIISTGIYHLLQSISLKYKVTIDEARSLALKAGLVNGEEELVSINQGFLKNIFNKSLQTFKSMITHTTDIPIFINGWSFLHPAEYYLRCNYQREVYIISSYFNWPSQFEHLYALQELSNST